MSAQFITPEGYMQNVFGGWRGQTQPTPRTERQQEFEYGRSAKEGGSTSTSKCRIFSVRTDPEAQSYRGRMRGEYSP